MFDMSGFSEEQRHELEHMCALLKTRMRDLPRRYVHSLGVAQTAIDLADAYGHDRYAAAVAGILHDWDKALDDAELLARAASYGIEVVGSPVLAVGLLHGPVAACELPHVFPSVTTTITQAVARHTVGAIDMTPLDMIVFVADAIEPNRHGAYAEELRSSVGRIPLSDLFFRTFSQGLSYVISCGRYLYPTAIDIYNAYATNR